LPSKIAIETLYGEFFIFELLISIFLFNAFCSRLCYHCTLNLGGKMPTISRSALVMYSVEQMYQLINDILAYPQFIPNCGDSKIISSHENEVTAALMVSKGGLKKWFTTKNTMIGHNKVQLDLVDGPFKKLTGHWVLTELSEEACKISLQLDYEFSSKVFDLAFGRVFNGLTNNMVQAFTQRAKEVYHSNG